MPGATTDRLVLPHDVEGVLVKVIGDRHAEHLAKLERLRELAPRTFEPFATVVRMSDATAERLSGDTVPACLLGVIGAPTLTRNEEDALDVVFQLGMQVTVMGQKRRDTLFRRDVMAWTTIECLLQRAPRSSDGLIHSIRLVDYEPLADGDKQRTLGDARMVFEVGVTGVVSLTGFLPSDGTEWPPEAGGAPDDSYDPVAPRPVADLTFQVDRTPIAE